MKDRRAESEAFQPFPGCQQAANCTLSGYCFDGMMQKVIDDGLKAESKPSPCTGVAKAQTNTPTKS